MYTKYIYTFHSYGYGFTTHEVRRIGFEFATHLGRRDNEDGYELSRNWYANFLKRHTMLKLSSPRDINRVPAFNREKISGYFNRLKNNLEEHNLLEKPHRIFNIGEKCIHQQYNPNKVVGNKTFKAIEVTPPEDKTITIIGCGNAIGQQIPPFFVFPGTHLQQKWLEDSTPGTNGDVSKSGWSNSDIFFKFIKDHFLKFIPRPTAEEPVLLIYNGRNKSHINVLSLSGPCRTM